MIFMQNPFETLGGAADVEPEDFLTACSSLSATQLGSHGEVMAPLQLGGSQDGSRIRGENMPNGDRFRSLRLYVPLPNGLFMAYP